MKNINNTQSIEQLIEQGMKIYAELQNKLDLEQSSEGKYIVIDVSSGKYFIGDTKDEALQKGRAELPDVAFFVKRIGGIDRVSRNYPFPFLPALKSGRARIL